VTESSKAVFLSYASQDAEAAARICEALRAAGIEVWFDKSELRGGDAWDQRIRRQIRDCALFVPIISQHTQARAEGYFRLEWDLADQRTHMVSRNKAFIVPVCVDVTSDKDADVPETFTKVQWTRLPEGQTSEAFCRRIAALLAGPEPQTQPRQVTATAVNLGPRRSSRRWTIWAAVGALIIAAIGWQIRRAMSVKPIANSSPTTAVVVPEKSIAVLPFVDMSEKKDQEYFSDGLSEELINQLSHNADLKVIARTSSFAFKGKNEDMRTIASKLGMANLLEGSVRKAGPQLRITAQLIRAADGVHLWSETYDRKLDDIFKVQDEISSTVAKALNAALGAGNKPTVAQASTGEIYSLMLQGNYFFYRSNAGDVDKAIELYKQAIALDPKNALAWARLAEAHVQKTDSNQMPFGQGRSAAQSALAKALALDPNLPRAHYVLGLVHANLDLDWDAAAAEYDRAVALDRHGEVADDARFNSASIAAFKEGRLEGLIAALQQDIVRNPLDPGSYNGLGLIQYAAGKFDQSIAAYQKLLDLDPGYLGAHANYAQSLLGIGKLPEALATAEQEPDQKSKLGVLPCIYWKMGRHADSDAALKTLKDRFADSSGLAAARMHACRGEVDQAFAQLERAYQQHDGDLEATKIDPMLQPLRSDPRFADFLRKLKLPLT
jgi:adenylate cyclase